MSGGKAYRHGYYATLPHTQPQQPSADVDFHAVFVVIVASVLIVLVTAIATDRSLLTTVDQAVRSMITDLGRLFLR